MAATIPMKWMLLCMIMAAKNRQNEKGQALIEFLLFLPFMLMMYTLVSSVSSSLNAAINQQKITRGYFYYRLQNNSMMPKPDRDESQPVQGSWNIFGMQMIGWAETLITSQPVATCFKFRAGLGLNNDDVCEEPATDRSSQFIKVGVVYGVCGATYLKRDNSYSRLPSQEGVAEAYGEQSCLIQ